MAAGTTVGGYAGEELVAVVRLDDLGEGEGWLGGLRVAPELRRQGIGKALLTHTLATASDGGIHTVRMLIEEDNLPSRTLSATLGFREVMAMAHLAGPLSPPSRSLLAVRLSAPPATPVGALRWVRARGGFTSPTTREAFRLVRATPGRLREEVRAGHLYGTEGGESLFALGVPHAVSWSHGTVRAFVPLDGPLDSALSGAANLLGGEETRLDLFLPLDTEAIGIAEGCGIRRGALWGSTIRLYEGGTA